MTIQVVIRHSSTKFYGDNSESRSTETLRWKFYKCWELPNVEVFLVQPRSTRPDVRRWRIWSGTLHRTCQWHSTRPTMITPTLAAVYMPASGQTRYSWRRRRAMTCHSTETDDWCNLPTTSVETSSSTRESGWRQCGWAPGFMIQSTNCDCCIAALLLVEILTTLTACILILKHLITHHMNSLATHLSSADDGLKARPDMYGTAVKQLPVLMLLEITWQFN